MKKNALSLAVATSVAALTMAAAHAQTEMYLNHEGTGEVLLFPFYDAENGNATNFHVVNTTADVKVVKVRFLEYKASYEVLDFNLFLSPEDHFAFGVVMSKDGTGGSIITSDNSCTVPALGQPNGGIDGDTVVQPDGTVIRQQPFVNFEFLNPIVYQGKDLDKAGITCNYNNNHTNEEDETQPPRRVGLINYAVHDTDLTLLKFKNEDMNELTLELNPGAVPVLFPF